MIGDQVTVAVTRRRAEPGDLCAAIRIAQRPIDVRICMMSGRCQDNSAYHASRQIDVEVGVVALIPMGPCDGERLLAGMGMPGPRPSRAGTRAQRRGRWRRVGAIVDEPGEDLMTDVIDRLAVAMNAHDLDAVA